MFFIKNCRITEEGAEDDEKGEEEEEEEEKEEKEDVIKGRRDGGKREVDGVDDKVI